MPVDWNVVDQNLATLKAEETDSFYTERMSIRQKRSLRSASNYIRRSERMLGRSIGDDALQAELNGGRIDQILEGDVFAAVGALASRTGRVLSTATKPLFDLLQIGQFTAAGAALEIVNGGNSYEALLRGSSEFLNALPFIDEEDASDLTGIDPTRVSFRDVLDAAEFKPFENERHNEWGIAAAGLVLDVVLDPTTYVGGAALRMVGSGAGRVLTPLIDVRGIKHVREGLGRKFVSKFGSHELARENPALREPVDKFLGGLQAQKGEITEGSIDIGDLAIQLRSDLSPTQARFLQLYFDQPKHFEGIVNELTVDNPGVKKLMMDKFNAFADEYRNLGTAESSAGLFDPTAITAGFSPARWEATRTSKTSFKKLMAKIGLPEEQQGHELSDVVMNAPELLGGVNELISKGKKLNTLEQRVLSAVGTELDPGVNFALRGIESVRARATKRFQITVLDDPTIARKVTDPVLLETMHKAGAGKSLQALVEEYGNKEGASIFETSSAFAKELGVRDVGVWSPKFGAFKEISELSSVTKLSKGMTFVDKDGVVHEVLGRTKGKSGKIKARRSDTNEEVLFGKESMVTPSKPRPSYVMPRAFINELNLADKIMKNDSEARKFLKSIQKGQNLWKGWAVASFGFHARNHMSNMFNNALAGVGFSKGFVPDYRPYARSFPLIFGKGKNTVLKLPDGTEVVGDEIMRLATRHNVVKTGVFGSDIPETVEEEMLDLLFKSKNKDNLFERLETATGADLDDALASIGGKTITRRDLLKGVGDTAPARADIEFVKHVMGRKNPALKFNRWLGTKVEDHARLTHFMDKIKKGASPEEAASSVKRYLFDYSELTEFERDFMKTALPFYTWMRKNIPLQFQSIMENPGRYGMMTAKPIEALESMSEDWKDIHTPDYFQEIHAVRMPKGFASLVHTMNTKFDDLAQYVGFDPSTAETGLQPVFINPNFPFQDLNRLNLKDILSSMSPIAKLPIETMLGEQGRGFSIFLDRPIERYPGQPTETGFLGSEDVRFGKKSQHILETIFPTIGKAQRLIDRAGRGQAVSQIMSEFFGIKAIQVDVDRANRSNVYRRREQIKAIRQKYHELGILRK